MIQDFLKSLAFSTAGGSGGNFVQNVASMFGGGGADSEELMREAASINWRMQREFAQNGLRWRMADAKAAGIHPVAALGMQPANASPVAINPPGDPAVSDIERVGNGLARAMSAGQTNLERLQERLLMSQIEGSDIDNALRLSQLNRTSGAQMGPGFPTGNPSLDDRPSAPISLRGTHLDNGPLTNSDAVDFDSDPIGYLAARGIISAFDLRSIGRDVKNWWHNRKWDAKYRGRQKYFTEGR